jgi:hypothetical protein
MVALIEDVLPWLVVFFVLDAVVQLRRGQVVFARTGLERFQLLHSGLHLAGALPFGAALTAYELPFVPTREGLWKFDPDARAAPPIVLAEAVSFLPWDSLQDVRGEGTAVKGAGRVLFRARSPRAARALAAELARLRGAAKGAWEAELARGLEARCDVAAVRARWTRVRLPAQLAAAFGTLEALVLFGALPALALLGAEAERWERVFALLLASHLGAVMAAAWALARSGASASDITSALGTLFFFPPYAARAGVHALRDALSDFEPLAVAAVLLPRAGFLRCARRELVRTGESRDATRHLGLAPYWDARRRALERLLAAAGTSTREVLAPPEPLPDVAAWCPLCLTEYRAGFAKCADCGVALAPAAPRASLSPATSGAGVARRT